MKHPIKPMIASGMSRKTDISEGAISKASGVQNLHTEMEEKKLSLF